MLTLDDIEALYLTRGHQQYSGEPVTQLRHALQAATLGESEGADDELVTAALLHDLGHLVHDLGATPTLQGLDDMHQHVAAPFLRRLFGARVVGAVQWHVDAKRYLCATRPGYEAALSADSQRSLVLQGGVFGMQDATRFIDRPGAADAVRVRLWDDAAKAAEMQTPPLAHFIERARRCSLG